MSLTYLLQQFDAIGTPAPGMSVTLDQRFTGSAELTAMFRAAFGLDSIPLTCMTWDRSAAGDSLKLAGTTQLLGIENAEFALAASQRDGELLLTLAVTTPSGWRFSQSFPSLPGYYDKSEPDEEKRSKPTFLDELSLGAGKLIFSNQAHASDVYKTDLVAGLNFAGELFFLGSLIGLKTLTGEDGPLALRGPVREYRSTPSPLEFLGLRLQAPLGLAAKDLPVRGARLYIKSPLDEDQDDPTVGVTRDPGIYLFAQSDVAGRTAELIAKYTYQQDPLTLSLYGRMTDFELAGFSSLTQTVGGDDIQGTLPAEIQAPQGLKLTDVGLAVNFTNPGIQSVMVGVGCDTHWEIVPNKLVIEEIGINTRITNPFNNKTRSLATGLSGLLGLGDTKLAVFAEYPTYRLSGGLPSGETIPLGHIIKSYFPQAPALQDMTVSRLFFSADPKAKTFGMICGITDVLAVPVGTTSFKVEGISFAVNYAPSPGVTGAFTAEMTVAGATAILSGELTNTLTLAGALQNVDLRKLWSEITGGEQLPEELPDIVFENLSLSVTLDTGAFTLLGNATVAWDHLSDAGALSTNVQFSLSRQGPVAPGAKAAFTASLTLQGTGPVNIADGFTLQAFNFLFNYQTNVGWQLSGGIGADVFDTRLDLQAGYESAQTGQKIKLRATATPPAKLINIDGVGSYSFAQFDLLLDRRAAADGKKKTYYDLRLASTVAIDNVFSLGGFLGLSDTAEGRKALTFKPNPGSTAFKISFPTGEGMGLTGELIEIGFVKESATSGWSFTGTTALGFTGFPGFLSKMLPSKVITKLVAGKSNVSLTALNVTDPVNVALPTLQGKSLGKATVQLTEVGVAIKPQLGLVIEAGLGLPAELNTYLGSQMFRVYQPGNVVSMSRTRFTISGTGVAIQFISSPFAGASAVVVNNELWFDVDLGEYGALSLKMPTFLYDGVSQYFEAGGGLKIKRPLALPLAPLKLFVEAVLGKDAASIFPSKIPIESVHFFDKNGDLQIDGLVSLLKKAGDVPSEVITALKQTAKLVDRLPSGFKHYLNIDLPEELEFKLGFSPTGRYSIGMLAPKTPVRVLFPSVVQSYVPMPGLCGIEVRKFSVGTIMAGSLFFGQVDATIDQFDFPSLAISLMLPSDKGFPLPTSDQLQRRIILDDVFCVIPVSQGLPIPLPVFYDEIGFEYLGVEGLGLQAHIGFPLPKVDGAAAMAVFQAFSSFFSDRKALLDPSKPPGGVDLKFTFHDEFLQAPEYLGNGLLGTKSKTLNVGLWKYIASLMNFSKTFSINDCIGAIPIENRVGSAAYKFAFMKFDADWMLTTPAEFRKGSFQNLKLSAGDVEDFMTVLPSVASATTQDAKAKEEGLVAFVRGKADLGFVGMEAAFGLAASGSMGFNTGFKIEGKLGVTELELSGAVMVNAPIATGTATAPVLQAATTTQATAALPAKTASGGRALSFNGKDTWIQIPANDSLVLPEYTVEIWLKPAKDFGREWGNILGIDPRRNNALSRNCFLALNANNSFYHHRFMDNGGGNSGAPNTPNGSVRWGQWQHVAITNDGATAKTYVDGKEAASGAVNGALTLLKDSFWIGKVSGENVFKGDIAEIRIWKRARGAGEIEADRYERIDADAKDLVSLYRFEEDTGTRAVDLCGRNHGTITNARFVDSDLVSLGGLDFDGKSEYIEVPDSQSLRLGAYTVEAWVKPYRSASSQVMAAADAVSQAMFGKKAKPQNLSEWSGIFGKKGRNYALFINNNNSYVHHRFHDASGTNNGPPNTPNGTVQWNKWNHLAITNDGKTARTYINGVKQAEGPVNGSLVIDNDKISFGRNANASNDQYFAGEIAEVRLWSRERSADELTGNMYRRLDGKDPSLVSLWRLSEATGDTLVDACGRNPGKLFMEGVSEPAKLQHDGLIFNGSGDSAFIAQSDKFKTGQYTLEAWIRPDKTPPGSWQCIWAGTGTAPKLFLSDKGLVSHRFKSQSSPDAAVFNTDVGAVRLGEWNHIAVTNDGKTCAIFVNGSKKAQLPVLGGLISDAAGINIGRGNDNTNPSYFRGSIDDLRYWSVARSPEQIAGSMNLPLTGQETGLVAYYTMDHTSGTQLVDSGPNKLNGTVTGATWALAASPASTGRAAIQIQGHAHLAVAGRKVMRGDLRLVDDQFWFSGDLDLFPKDYPLAVRGHVEGMISKQRFYVSGETQNQLFGLTLSQSRMYLSNEQIRLEGRWLGAYLLLDVSWANNDPTFKGSVGFGASASLDFGTVYIGGVKVASNVRISVNIGADVSVAISRNGFSGDITAKFSINGKGFDLHFGVDIAPKDFTQLFDWIKQRIIDEPEKYLAHLFSDAVAWLKNVGEGTIEFAKDAGEAVGKALKGAFNVSKDAVAGMMKGAGYTVEQVGAALNKAYQVGSQEAAKLLKSANYAADQVGNALKSAYGTSADEAAKLLRGAGYAADQVGNALKSGWNYSADATAKALKGAGYAANEVGNALKSGWNYSADAATKALKGAGYAADEVGGALKSCWNTSADEANKLLHSAGYATDQIDKALKSGWNTSVSALENVGKKMDPTKW